MPHEDKRRTLDTRSPSKQCCHANPECVWMEKILPVNIAEGAGALHVAWRIATAAHVVSVQRGMFTGKIFSIHSSQDTNMLESVARRQTPVCERRCAHVRAAPVRRASCTPPFSRPVSLAAFFIGDSLHGSPAPRTPSATIYTVRWAWAQCTAGGGCAVPGTRTLGQWHTGSITRRGGRASPSRPQTLYP